MKNQPLLLLICALFGCFVSETLNAQNLEHPGNVNAIPQDTLSVEVALDLGVTMAKSRFVIFLMPDSTYDLLLSLDSLRFTGNGTTIDSTDLAAIMEGLSGSAVDSAIAGGYIDTSLSIQYVRVFKPAWATRYAAGLSTYFLPCSPDDHSHRTYRCEEINGHYSISLSATQTTACSVCSTTCEPTVEEGTMIE